MSGEPRGEREHLLGPGLLPLRVPGWLLWLAVESEACLLPSGCGLLSEQPCSGLCLSGSLILAAKGRRTGSSYVPGAV